MPASYSTYITAYRCHVFFTISSVYIQAVLSVKLTFVPRQHVLKLNKHGNVNNCPPKNIHFLLAWLENKYLFGKSERQWAHELTSQTGGELMSWSPSVSAALIRKFKLVHIRKIPCFLPQTICLVIPLCSALLKDLYSCHLNHGNTCLMPLPKWTVVLCLFMILY